MAAVNFTRQFDKNIEPVDGTGLYLFSHQLAFCVLSPALNPALSLLKTQIKNRRK